MKLKSDAKILALGSKNDLSNLMNFNTNSGNFKNLLFDGLLL